MWHSCRVGDADALDASSTTVSMHMSPVKLLPFTPTKRTLLVPDGSVACGGRSQCHECQGRHLACQ